MSLFRQEVFDAQKINWTGTIVLIRPVSFTFLTPCALGAGLVMAVGSWCDRFTKSYKLL